MKTSVAIEYYRRNHAVNCVDHKTVCRRLDHLTKHFGNHPISNIPQRIKTYRRFDRVSHSTIRVELCALRTALLYAEKHGQLDGVQVPQIPLPEAAPPRDRWLTLDEINILQAAAEQLRNGDRLSRAERFIWIALEAPARKMTIEKLEWDRVDLKNRVIDFRQPFKRQTKKRQVVCPISDRLLPVLERAYEERTGIWVLDNSGNIRKAFEKTVAQSGLKDVTPHVLRHTAATHMARAGVPLWTIAGVLGNSLAMVERTYAHHDPAHLRAALNWR